MKTYEFSAFRTERYAAYGIVSATSAAEARDKVLQLYQDEGLGFNEFVEGDDPDHIVIENGDEWHDFDEATFPDFGER